MIKLILIDDHPMVTNGIQNILRVTGNIKVTAVYHSATSVLDNIRGLDADVIMLDMQLPDGNGYDIAKEVLQVYPAMGILVFSSTDAPSQVRKMQQLGCKGYLLKNAANDIILQAVEAVYNGSRFLSPELEGAFMNKMFDTKKQTQKINLTAREKEVLVMIAQGYSSQKIASELALTHSSIEFNRSNILQKLALKNTAELIRVAIQNNLV